MNFYPFHIGDYLSNTGHLEPMQDLAYRRMIDLYYLRESPLPPDTSDIARLIRMKGLEADIQVVLDDFFMETPTGWAHNRCEEEIQAAQIKRNKAKESAAKRWTKDEDANAMPTHSERNANAMPTQCPPNAPNPNPNPNPIEEPLGENGKPFIPPCPVEEIISAYHETLPMLPKLRVRTATRDGQIKARWRQFYEEGDFETKEGGLDCFRWYFEQKVKPSKFLTGQTQTNGRKPFLADLEWITNAGNFAKIIEGKYE